MAGVKVTKRENYGEKLNMQITESGHNYLLARRMFTIGRDSVNSAYAADTNGLISTKVKRSV